MEFEHKEYKEAIEKQQDAKNAQDHQYEQKDKANLIQTGIHPDKHKLIEPTTGKKHILHQISNSARKKWWGLVIFMILVILVIIILFSP